MDQNGSKVISWLIPSKNVRLFHFVQNKLNKVQIIGTYYVFFFAKRQYAFIKIVITSYIFKKENFCFCTLRLWLIFQLIQAWILQVLRRKQWYYHYCYYRGRRQKTFRRDVACSTVGTIIIIIIMQFKRGIACAKEMDGHKSSRHTSIDTSTYAVKIIIIIVT